MQYRHWKGLHSKRKEGLGADSRSDRSAVSESEVDVNSASIVIAVSRMRRSCFAQSVIILLITPVRQAKLEPIPFVVGGSKKAEAIRDLSLKTYFTGLVARSTGVIGSPDNCAWMSRSEAT